MGVSVPILTELQSANPVTAGFLLFWPIIFWPFFLEPKTGRTSADCPPVRRSLGCALGASYNVRPTENVLAFSFLGKSNWDLTGCRIPSPASTACQDLLPRLRFSFASLRALRVPGCRPCVPGSIPFFCLSLASRLRCISRCTSHSLTEWWASGSEHL